MRRREVADGSIRVFGSYLRTVERDCGRLEGLSEGQLLSWLDNRRLASGAPVASSTRAGYISALNGFYAWAIEHTYLESNPVAGIVRPPLESPASRIVGSDELERAIHAASGELRCWIVIAAYEGLKPQQVAGLLRDDVDTSGERPVLRVRRRGGELDRGVELHPRVLEALEALPMPAEGRLFPSADASLVSRQINRLFRRLGIPLRADDLRSWHGSEAYWMQRAGSQSGVDTESSEPLRAQVQGTDAMTGDEVIAEDLEPESLVIDGRTQRMLRFSVGSRKAIVLIGPPGTGKTALAQSIVREAAEDCLAFGLSKPPRLGAPVTPDESWTAAEIVGGSTVHQGHVIFRPGHVLRAIENDTWLLLDEANRGDLDKILGGLLTWLSEPKSDVVVGRLSEAPGAPTVAVGWGTRPECEVINREWLDDPLDAPRGGESVRFLAGTDWRLLATYNAVDAQRVFRFGQALGRRFATVPVPPAPEEVVAALATEKAADLALPARVGQQVAGLYAAHQRNPATLLGPAAFLKIPDYVASVVQGSEFDEVPPEQLDDVVAEGYLINVGHSLARLDDQLDMLGIEIGPVLGDHGWEWVRDQLPSLG